MECAVEKMRQSQFLHEVGHLVRTYVPESFAPPAATFEEWTGDLDKLLDGLDTNSGTHDIGDTLITLTLSAPPAWLKAWTNAPAERKNTVYMDLSKALQARLKELVTFYWFADASRYGDLASAAAPIVYSCLPPSTSIRTDGDRLAELDTKRDIYWDNADMNQIRAMANCREAQSNLRERLKAIETTLRGIPSLAGKAGFYAQDQMDEVVAAALRRFSPGSQVPELLGSLLFLESRLVDNAVRVGTEIGRFRRAALTRPSEALEHLAKFGLDIADTFNQTFGDHPFMNGASRPLATLLFMESARQFDPALADIRPAALLDIKIVKSGQIGIDDMLSAEIPADIILHEQKFLEA
jgi:hypothetical protein